MSTFLLVHGERPVRVSTPSAVLEAHLGIPERPRALVVIASSGSKSRFADGNRVISRILREAGFATLVVNLLTANESLHDSESSEIRFQLPLLAARLTGAASWAALHPSLRDLSVAYLAGGVSAAAAFEAAAEFPEIVSSIVSRCGRVELAGASLREVRAATLLVVGELDIANNATNQRAVERLPSNARLHVVPGGKPALSEESEVETVANLACAWFERTLPRSEMDSAPLHLAAAAHV